MVARSLGVLALPPLPCSPLVRETRIIGIRRRRTAGSKALRSPLRVSDGEAAPPHRPGSPMKLNAAQKLG